jgi:hypothetical protein
MQATVRPLAMRMARRDDQGRPLRGLKPAFTVSLFLSYGDRRTDEPLS